MKREDLEKLGLTKEQIDSVCDLNNADMAPVRAELTKAKDDLKAAQDKVAAQDGTIKELNKDLAKFKDEDVSGLKQKIADLEKNVAEKEAQHKQEIADRDFNDLVKDAIVTAKGKNAKAITALLEIETLKASKNQREDIAKAIKALTEAEDSKMLFGEKKPEVVGKKDTIGNVGSTGSGGNATETLASALTEHYSKGDE